MTRKHPPFRKTRRTPKRVYTESRIAKIASELDLVAVVCECRYCGHFSYALIPRAESIGFCPKCGRDSNGEGANDDD